MHRTIALLAIGLVAAACGSRPLTNEDATPGADPDSAPACAHNESPCDNDADCASDQRCVFTDLVPGCGGTCAPRPLTPNPCTPPAGPTVTVDVLLGANGYVARITNKGCKPVYRLAGCCGEGDPTIYSKVGAKWDVAACSSSPLGICCDAAPTCDAILPGESTEIAIHQLGLSCCGEQFQVAVGTYDNADCSGVKAFSNSDPFETAQPPTCAENCGDITCGPGEACVKHVAWQVAYSCEPIPPSCGGTPTCACMGDQACPGSANLCLDVPDMLSCNCTNC